MNEADSLLPSLEQGLDGAWDTEEIALGEGTPYARVRVLMARAMERLAGQALLSRLSQVSSQDVRRDLSLLCRVEARQEASWTAAGSLGAPRFVAFLRIIFPLSVSGLVTGAVLVFTGCMTAYTTPQLLGATDTQVLSTMVYQYAMSLRDWTQASAIAVVMIVVTMLVSSVFNRLSRKINPLAA